MFEKLIEHNEIDAKNLTNSEQSYLMMKDNAFREHYFECFDHEPIECIWPEITSECIEEPDTFVRVNLLKTLITKKTVWEANQLIERKRNTVKPFVHSPLNDRDPFDFDWGTGQRVLVF